MFFQLLLRTEGDVETALEWMRHLQERGLLPADWDLDAFIKRLKDAGTSLHKIRLAFEQLEEQVGEGWRDSDITLLSDGTTIYAATSPEEVIDLLQRGQGVFGIAIRPVHDEVRGELHKLFPDRDIEAIEDDTLAGASGI